MAARGQEAAGTGFRGRPRLLGVLAGEHRLHGGDGALHLGIVGLVGR